jgi:uncharacterized protein
MTEDRSHEHRFAGDGGPTNHLAGSSSPYLLLHQHNPVDWYPWGPEALEKARREDKPIFLSVGYSTCYWCHVMERESFSDPQTARVLNEGFVSIKVDREERPDLDEIYMTATQLLTQHGGWPNSVFLTPDLKPFYAGTYFPPDDRHGLPGFGSLLANLRGAWEERRLDVGQQADEVAAAMRKALEERDQPTEDLPGAEAAERSFEALARRFDADWGGFGHAPKFPTPSNLYLLLELAGEEPRAAHMLHQTLDEMARGGLYDQLAGGFHRYATDREWKIPHFEKMLYDNGFLLELYAREHERTGDPEMARVARETAGFLAREMTGDHGGFLSAIDAETDAFEGAFYVWTAKELEDVLGPEDYAFLAPLYGFDRAPFFEKDHYVLHLPRPLAEAAERRKTSREDLLGEMAPLRDRLLAAREERKRPLTDDKVLTDWNGIAITGMAVAGRLLEDHELVRRAGRAARFVLGELRAGDGTLLHVWREGSARLEAFLSDYAFLIRGLLALHDASGEDRWLDAAVELAEQQVERLRSPRGGFYNASRREDLLFRPRDTMDGALPAANSISALNFLRLGKALGGEEGESWRRQAAEVLRSFGGLIGSYPDAVRMATVALRRMNAAADQPEPGAAVPSPFEQLAGEAQRAVGVEARRVSGERFEMTLEIAPGWHLYANPASDPGQVATRVDAREVEYPEGETLAPAGGEPIRVYRGTVRLTGRVPQDGGKVRLTYQTCDAGRCLPAVTREVSIALPPEEPPEVRTPS